MPIRVTKPRPGARLDYDHPLSRDLKAWWLFNEGSGQKVRDVGGAADNSIVATAGVVFPWVGSPRGGAMAFDGSSGRQMVTGSGFAAPHTGEFTYLAWLYQNSRTGDQVHLGYGIDDGFGVDDIEISNASGVIPRVLYEDTATTVALTRYTVGEWHQIALIRRGTTLWGYTDTIAEGLDSGATATISDGHDFSMGGAAAGTRYFNGMIDDVRLYSRALSDDELLWLYHEPYAGILEPSRVRYFVPSYLSSRPLTAIPLRLSGMQLDYAHTLSSNLLAYWPMQDRGSRLHDLGPNRLTHDNTFLGGTQWVGSPMGQAVRFNQGATDSFTFGHVVTAAWTGALPVSVSAWYRADAGLADGTYTIVGKQLSSGNFSGWGLSLKVVGGTHLLRYEWRNTLAVRIDVDSGGSLPPRPGEWHHVVATYDGSKLASGIEIYIDGFKTTKNVVLDALGASATSSAANLCIGGQDDAVNWFVGDLANIRIWQRVLTPREAEQLSLEPFAGTLRIRHRQLEAIASDVLLFQPDGWPQLAKPPVLRQPHRSRATGLGLVAHWPFAELGGQSVQDVSGQGQHLTLTSTDPVASWTPSLHGGGLLFNGDTQYLSTPMTPRLQVTTITLAVWLKVRALPSGATPLASLVETGLATNSGYGLYINPQGRIGFTLKTSGGTQAGGTTDYVLEREQWLHVALTYNGAVGGDALYVNGQARPIGNITNVNRSNSGGEITAPSADLRIASRSGTSQFFAGFLDDVRIYNRPLSAVDIRTLYNEGIAHQSQLPGSAALYLKAVSVLTFGGVAGVPAIRMRHKIWR